MDIQEYVKQQLELIDLEQKTERELDTSHLKNVSPKSLEADGICLTSLVIDEYRNGLYGRILVTLVSSKGSDRELPPHQFTPRDVILLRPRESSQSLSLLYEKDSLEGIVYSLTATSVTLAFSEPAPALGGGNENAVYNLFKTTDAYTLNCYRATLRRLPSLLGDAAHPAAAVLAVLFSGHANVPALRHADGRPIAYADIDAACAAAVAAQASDAPPASASAFAPAFAPASLPPAMHMQPHVPLNAPQLRAVAVALSMPPVTLIHGPPGTGKSTVLVEIIRQLVARGQRVLVCAASNAAVDHLLLRAVQAERGLPAVRIGHPARAMPAVAPLTLDHQVEDMTAAQLAPDRKLAKKLSQDLTRLSRAAAGSEAAEGNFYAKKKAKQSKAGARGWAGTGLSKADAFETKRLQGELRDIGRVMKGAEQHASAAVLGQAQVVACTLTGAYSGRLKALLQPPPEDREGDPRAGRPAFDVVLVDECAQALEVACLQAVCAGSRLVMAGDHLQLPPTVQSEEAARAGLAVTLFERLVRSAEAQSLAEGQLDGLAPEQTPATGQRKDKSAHGAPALPAWAPRADASVLSACTLLTTQHRMNREIMQWSSGALYGGRLVAHPSVAQHTLFARDYDSAAALAPPAEPSFAGAVAVGVRGAEGTASSLETLSPWVFLDTAGVAPEDEDAQEAASKSNRGECALVIAYLRRLLRLGVRGEGICVITPYRGQVKLLREAQRREAAALEGRRGKAGAKADDAAAADWSEDAREWRAVEVGTVDGFQGREKEAVVISATRSNESLSVGFLSDNRRMNVAVTRARKHMCLIGDSATLSADAFLAGLVDYSHEGAQDNPELAAGPGDSVAVGRRRYFEVPAAPPAELRLDALSAREHADRQAAIGKQAPACAVVEKLRTSLPAWMQRADGKLRDVLARVPQVPAPAPEAAVAATLSASARQGPGGERMEVPLQLQPASPAQQPRDAWWAAAYAPGSPGSLPERASLRLTMLPSSAVDSSPRCPVRVVLGALLTEPLPGGDRRAVHGHCDAFAAALVGGASVADAARVQSGDAEPKPEQPLPAPAPVLVATRVSEAVAAHLPRLCAECGPAAALPLDALQGGADSASAAAVEVVHLTIANADSYRKRMLVALVATVDMHMEAEITVSAPSEAPPETTAVPPPEAPEPEPASEDVSAQEAAEGTPASAEPATDEDENAFAALAADQPEEPPALPLLSPLLPHLQLAWGKHRLLLPIAQFAPAQPLPEACCALHEQQPPQQAAPVRGGGKGKGKAKGPQKGDLPDTAAGVPVDPTPLPFAPAPVALDGTARDLVPLSVAALRARVAAYTGVPACQAKLMARGKLLKTAPDFAAVLNGPAAAPRSVDGVSVVGAAVMLVGAASLPPSMGPLASELQTTAADAPAAPASQETAPRPTAAAQARAQGQRAPLAPPMQMSTTMLAAAAKNRNKVPARTQSSTLAPATQAPPAAGRGDAGSRDISADPLARLVYGERLDRDPRAPKTKVTGGEVDALLRDKDVSVDALLEGCILANRQDVCAFDSCTRKPVAFASARCTHCQKMYCAQHGNGMFHGCEAAVAKARKAAAGQSTRAEKAAAAEKLAKVQEKFAKQRQADSKGKGSK